MMKTLLIALATITLASCSSNTYKVEQEADLKNGRLLDEVPQWYIDASVSEGFFDRGTDSNYIYSVGQGSSPDLQLAIQKATLIAKASLADQLKGEMNQRSELYTTEIGSNNNKKVASKVEDTIVNVVAKTMVQGYEQWEKAVYETPYGQYRVYLGLKMGIGDANKLADYIAENANQDIDIDVLAEEAIEEVL